ncbi:MAG: hypothetical protein IKB01_08435 [Lachnospiraceae bacterium]|nr:hypothetical protein [Lachnospiraceae bacterium]
MKKHILKLLTVVLAMVMFTIPVSAATPRFNNIGSASLLMAFDTNYTVYVGLDISAYSHGSGVSGLVKLFDSEGTCLAIWSVSDYEKPIGAEFTYPGVRGETYTATFCRLCL